MKTENFPRMKMSYLKLMMTWSSKTTRKTTKHPLVIANARPQERGSCWAWTLSCCCPPFVHTSLRSEEEKVNLQVARLVVARVEEDRKVLDDLPTLVAAAEKGKAKDVQDQFVMVHRVDKFVSSAVRRIIGRPKMDDGSSNPKKRSIGAYVYGA